MTGPRRQPFIKHYPLSIIHGASRFIVIREASAPCFSNNLNKAGGCLQKNQINL